MKSKWTVLLLVAVLGLAFQAQPASGLVTYCVQCKILDFGFLNGKLAICINATDVGIHGEECVFGPGDEDCYVTGTCVLRMA